MEHAEALESGSMVVKNSTQSSMKTLLKEMLVRKLWL